MKTLNIISTTIALTACCSFFTPLMASTPDGETPAEELVCEEAGLTGPLKGLCNAYCEAMDCDSDDPHASAKACSKVLGNYAKHAEPGSVIPCEATVECPCIATWENNIGAAFPITLPAALSVTDTGSFLLAECAKQDPDGFKLQAYQLLEPSITCSDQPAKVDRPGDIDSSGPFQFSSEAEADQAFDACLAYLQEQGCNEQP